MPLINTSIPNLIQGVSQQPDVTRFSGQCELQENAMSSVVDGLAKRPNTRHVARLLTSAISSNSFVHFINRSDAEQYVVIHDGTYLCAYNLSDGAEATITEGTTDYKSTLPAGKYPANGYLAPTTPRTSFKALTVSDSTFLVNTSQVVAQGTTTSNALEGDALIFIKQGDYAKKYGFKLEYKIGVGDPLYIYPIAYNSGGTNYEFRNNSAGYFVGLGNSNNPSNTDSANGNNFSIGDVVTIPLPSTINYAGVTHDIQVTTLPTLEVTDVNTSFGVSQAKIVNGGSFKFYNSGASAYLATSTGPTFINSSGGDGLLVIPSTNSRTTATVYETNYASSTGTSTSSSQATAGNADSATILTGLGSHDASGSMDTYFDRVTTETEQNLYVISAKSTVASFNISPIDGLAGDGIGIVYKQVNSIDDLPLYAKNDFKVKVSGDAELNEDDYYVQFKTTSGDTYGVGSWVECLGDNVIKGYNSSTLPIELVNNAENQFKIRTMKFADRVSGNDDTNPLASFKGQAISNLFFFKNRLGFLSNENIIMTESGLGQLDDTGQLEYNFNRSTVTSLLDDDPIDISVSSSRVTNLKSAVGFQENLILFSANGQFVLKGGDVLTPKTVSITPVTNFDIDANTDPIALGAYVYFPFNRVGFTGVREFSLNASTDVYDSTEVTEHVPRYIPEGVNVFTGTTSEDCLLTVSENDLSTLYVYRYFYSGAKKLLSSWFKFTLDGEIRGASFIKSTLYIVLANPSTETNLVKIPFTAGLTDSNVNHNTHLDMRFYKSLSNTDTITLPYTADTNTLKCFKTDGTALTCTNTNTTLTLTNGNVTGNVWVGLPYTMKYTFSELIFKESSGQNVTPSNSSKLMLKNGTLFFSDTSTFKVKVTPKNRTTDENIFAASTVGGTVLGTLDQSDGAFRFPIFSSAEDTTITVEDDSAFNVKLSSAEFEALVKPRSKRFG